MLNIFKIITIIGLLSVTSLFSSVQTSDKQANELEKVSLQLQWLDQFQFAGYYMAKEKGFYKDVGLDVELKKYNNFTPVSEVLNKKATYGIGRSTLIIDKSKGADIKLLAAAFQSSPSVFISTKESNIKSIKDFSSKKMMITDDASTSVPLLAIAKREGLEIDSIKRIQHSFNIDDLINKKTDLYSAYISNEPYLLQEKGIEINIFNPAELGFDFYDDILFTSAFEMKNHKQRAINFTNASVKGWEYAFSHIDETVELILKKHNSQNKSKEALLYEANALKKLAYFGTDSLGELDLDHLKRIYDIYNIFGYIENKVDLESLMYKRQNAHAHGIEFTQEEKDYIKTNQTIRFTGHPNWLPFEAFNESGEYIGILSEFQQHIEAQTGMHFKKIISKSWVNALNIARNSNIDVIASDMSDKVLKNDFNPIESFIKNTIVIIMKNDYGFVNSIDDIKNKKIAIIKNYGYNENLYKMYPNIKFIEVKNIQEALFGVETGKFDASLASLATSNYFILEMGLEDLGIVGKTDIILKVTLFVHKSKPLLHSILNKAIKSLTQKERQDILRNWYQVQSAKIINYDQLIKTILIFIVILLFFVYRQYILSKTNKKLENLAQKLQDSHDMLSKLTQSMPGVTTQFRLFPDGHATFPYASRKIVDIYGVHPEDIVNDIQPAFKNIHPDDLNMMQASIKESAQNMTHWHMQYRVNLAHKGLRWIEGSANPEKLDDGSILWHGYLHDITEERKQFELYKQQALENKLLLGNTLDGFLVVAEDGNIIDVNDAYCKMSGYSEDELLRMNVSDIELIESEEKMKIHFQNIIQNGSDTFDTIHRKKDGNNLHINVSVTYLHSTQSKFLTFVRDITQKKKHEQEIEQLAYFDKLTALPNRTLLADRIEHAIKHSNRNNRDLAICMLDLDGFKEVNDLFGHDAGDIVLVEAAKRMQKEVREDDTVARLGGDEFVIILTDVINNEACALALQRVLDSLSQTYTYKNKHINSITASIGVSVYPHDNVHSDTLLRHADIAMYKSKNSGKNKFTFFDTTSEHKVQETSKTLNRMRKAIDSGEFCLYYQAKYETSSNLIKEVEALVRWNHPLLGLLTPAEFLPAIQSDDELSLLLDQWVVQKAFEQLMLWNEENIELKVCINISPKQFQGNIFKDWIFKLIESEKIPKTLLKNIEFEILETAVMDNLNESNEFISRLHESGASFALDDFGTGYSSLIHLKELNINTIKIDQVFVREMFDSDASMTIVKAVIALSEAFELSITAEGAQTDKHVDKLIEMGCDEIQGYAISRPLPASDIVEFITTFEFQRNR